MSNLESRLYKAWKNAVSNDKVINQFVAAQDDPVGRWAKGDQIMYGIRFNQGELAYYAHNLSQSCNIRGAIEEKRVGEAGYLCRLNSFRALRPGASGRPLGCQPNIPAEPENCRFHCQDIAHPLSLLVREPLLQVKLTHYVWNAYYNVSPLDKEGHFLWVPTALPLEVAVLPHIPQELSPQLLTDMVELFGQLSHTILFFNSLHAGASVNHIHFQAIYHRQPLPIETASSIVYKGYHMLDDYPVQAIVFQPKSSVNEIVACVERLQQENMPFNLVMLKECILIVARNIEHEIVSEFPGDGFAALGMCGAIATIDRKAYDTVNQEMIESAFRKMVVPARQLVDSWAREHNVVS